MMGSVYANTGGYTKKMIVYALSYIGYSVGNIVGPLTFTTDQAPKYTGGKSVPLHLSLYPLTP